MDLVRSCHDSCLEKKLAAISGGATIGCSTHLPRQFLFELAAITGGATIGFSTILPSLCGRIRPIGMILLQYEYEYNVSTIQIQRWLRTHY